MTTPPVVQLVLNMSPRSSAVWVSAVLGGENLKMLGDWLTERALEHDRPSLLLRLACDFLTAESVIRPAVTTVERSVIGARQRATAETYQRLASQLAEPRRCQLDQLLVVAPELGVTRTGMATASRLGVCRDRDQGPSCTD